MRPVVLGGAGACVGTVWCQGVLRMLNAPRDWARAGRVHLAGLLPGGWGGLGGSPVALCRGMRA